uniref:Uncharacterized protein n=1 Tax=Mycena chlorophos TaxID=658473 RepID=A0ABQ0KWC3_MYCCL|nr:predicted protein [Mycena chlorophos]
MSDLRVHVTLPNLASSSSSLVSGLRYRTLTWATRNRHKYWAEDPLKEIHALEDRLRGFRSAFGCCSYSSLSLGSACADVFRRWTTGPFQRRCYAGRRGLSSLRTTSSLAPHTLYRFIFNDAATLVLPITTASGPNPNRTPYPTPKNPPHPFSPSQLPSPAEPSVGPSNPAAPSRPGT